MKNFLHSIEKRRLSDSILDQLKTLLLERDLKPGDKLPSERELASIFKVGRPSIREALRTLNILGVLDIRPGHGVFVKTPDAQAYLDGIQESIGFLLEVEHRTFLEILEVRSVLESHTAILAAKNATEEDLARLEEAYLTLSRIQIAYSKDPDEEGAENWIEADYEFHKAISLCSHNGVLMAMINFLKSLVQRTSRKLLSMPDLLKVGAEFNEEHKRILEAIKAHSEQEAAQAMSVHLQHAQEVMADLISSEKNLGIDTKGQSKPIEQDNEME